MAEKTQQKRGFFILMMVLIAVVVVPISYFILISVGEKSGIEFSPDDFTMRRFNYNRIPIINWVKRGIVYEAYQSTTASTLIDDDLIRVTGRSPKRWHLVDESRFFSDAQLPAECDARFLTNYFELSDAKGENIILKWNTANPNSAKVLWPLVAEFARENVYLPIPGILDFALTSKKADSQSDFVDSLKLLVSEAWTESARSCQVNDDHSNAVRRFDKAIKIGGESSALLSARNESLSLSDKNE